MRVLICDYPEPMNRDLSAETGFLRAALGGALTVDTWVYDGCEAHLLEHLAGADALLTAYLPFDAALLRRAAAGGLRCISIEATGYDSIDTAAAQQCGIGVCVIGEYCTQEVADHTLALALAVSRRLKVYERDIERGRRFDFSAAGPLPRFSALTWGILGFGRIGRAVTRRAQGFGMRVVACDPGFPPAEAAKLGVQLLPFGEVLACSGVLSLHLPLTAATHHILNDAAFAQMRCRPAVVNVARGGLVDEAALVRALDGGLVCGAGLDVLETESHAETAANPLVGRPDVVLTPHAAFCSADAMRACARISSENIAHFLQGHPAQVSRMVTGSPA